MDKNEELKAIMDEVQRLTELKKAAILKTVSGKERGRDMGKGDNTNNREGGGPPQEMFSSANGTRATDKNTGLTNVASEDNLVREKIHEAPAAEEDGLWSFNQNKRYCLSKKCKFSFQVGKSFKKAIKRCMRCGGPTIFIIDSPF